MYSPRGLKASELVKLIQEAIEEHGDREVFGGGEDYPGGAEGIHVEVKGNGYIPKGAFVIWFND